jgi:hypothetical protein
MKTTATVMDANNRSAGRQLVTLECDDEGVPACAEYNSETYFSTGKIGESQGKNAGAPAGAKMVEMRGNSGDHCLWVSYDGKWVHED